MHRMELHGKIGISGVGVILAALVLAVPLTFLVVDDVLLGLKEHRLRFELNEIRNSVSNLMDIGLPLSALRRTQDLIDRSRARDPQIDSILVYDPAGKILYSTDLGEIGATIPSHWPANGGDKVVYGSDDLVVVTGLSNSFGTYAGGIALRFAMTNIAAQREEVWLLLTTVAGAGLALSAAAINIGSRRLLRPLRTGLCAGVADLESLVGGRPPPEAVAESMPDWLRDAYCPFVERVRHTLADLDTYAEEVSRLDDLG